jgi:phage gp29-like protein
VQNMPQIVDHNGQPINTGLLKTTIATPTTTGVRQIIASASHGLDPELLGNMLRQAVNGDASAYLRLAEDMEEKYLHYGSELSTRKRALVGLELYVEPAGDDAVSQRAAELVEQALAPIKENLFDILDAIGKGFSVHEIDWETSAKQWMPVGLSCSPTGCRSGARSRKRSTCARTAISMVRRWPRTNSSPTRSRPSRAC